MNRDICQFWVHFDNCLNVGQSTAASGLTLQIPRMLSQPLRSIRPGRHETLTSVNVERRCGLLQVITLVKLLYYEH